MWYLVALSTASQDAVTVPSARVRFIVPGADGGELASTNGGGGGGGVNISATSSNARRDASRQAEMVRPILVLFTAVPPNRSYDKYKP